jgi:hypothetical protein
MSLTGFDKNDALRCLIMRNELLLLQQRGLATDEAVEELLQRIKGLSGFKRKTNNEEQTQNALVESSEDVTSTSGTKKKRLKSTNTSVNTYNTTNSTVDIDTTTKRRTPFLSCDLPKKKLKGP